MSSSTQHVDGDVAAGAERRRRQQEARERAMEVFLMQQDAEDDEVVNDEGRINDTNLEERANHHRDAPVVVVGNLTAAHPQGQAHAQGQQPILLPPFEATTDNARPAAVVVPDDDDVAAAGIPQQQQQQQQEPLLGRPVIPHVAASSSLPPRRLTYRSVSFVAAIALLYHAGRSRQQYYLAAVYLRSSKWAYVILGNALVAAAMHVFETTCRMFLVGLRLQEAESLQDFFRWNVTETCLALTMFRSELHVGIALEFVLLILLKCLHHVAAVREQHVRMTEFALQETSVWPVLRFGHVRLLCFFLILQGADLCLMQSAVTDILSLGPSVSILFAFEAAILLVAAWSHILLWQLHVLDSWMHHVHDHHDHLPIPLKYFRWLYHPWKEYKATFVFAVELQAQAVQFMFYLTFFAIVLTYYGMPINLFREVYMSFAMLKERLTAFLKYRHLMASMNRFPDATEESLRAPSDGNNASGDSASHGHHAICIICRDEMIHVNDCKLLPGCRHAFHKACLREWLVQQQTCPTCRSDITEQEARERQLRVQEAAASAAAERQQLDQERQAIDEGTREETAQGDDQSTQQQLELDGTGVSSLKEASRLGGNNNSDNELLPPPLIQEPASAVAPGPGGSAGRTVRWLFPSTMIPSDEQSAATTSRSAFASKATTTTTTSISTIISSSIDADFPALYKVINREGASVWQSTTEHSPLEENANSLSSLLSLSSRPYLPLQYIRAIEHGVIVLAFGIYRTDASSNNNNNDDDDDDFDPRTNYIFCSHKHTLFVKVPDGWMSLHDVECVYKLPSLHTHLKQGASASQSSSSL